MRAAWLAAVLAAGAAAVQSNEARRGQSVLGDLSRADCSRFLEETYGAIEGWEPKEMSFRHLCTGMMVKQLQLAQGVGSANQTCAHFATAAVELRGKGLPQLPELEELWCRPSDGEGHFAGLRKTSTALLGRLGSWWHSHSRQPPQRNGTLALLEVFPGKALPGAGLAVQTLDFASKRRDQLKGAAWSAVDGLRNALDFLCDDACGLRANAPSKLRIIN
eukprot:s4748_g3.t1